MAQTGECLPLSRVSPRILRVTGRSSVRIHMMNPASWFDLHRRDFVTIKYKRMRLPDQHFNFCLAASF